MSRWTREQLRNLRELEAPVTPEATIHIIPISRGGRDEGYGSSIMWDARLYKRGVMGPREVNQAELEAVGLSPEDAKDWAEKTLRASSTLNRLYPVIVPEIEARVKEIVEEMETPLLPTGEDTGENTDRW
jgi:hypothetical protein